MGTDKMVAQYIHRAPCDWTIVIIVAVATDVGGQLSNYSMIFETAQQLS